MERQGFQARSPSISEILFSVSYSITFCPKVISATCATFSASVLVEKSLRALIFQNCSSFTPYEAEAGQWVGPGEGPLAQRAVTQFPRAGVGHPREHSISARQ